MIDTSLFAPTPFWRQIKRQRIWLISAALLLGMFAISPALAIANIRFVATALFGVSPFLLLSVALAAYSTATGADQLIARALRGNPVKMIIIAAMIGGLSPFCSCGVIPLIAALLVMGVPLSAVMAFWLASPVIDPSMFVLTVGVLGQSFAIGKLLAAIGLGVAGGSLIHLASKAGYFSDVLRPELAARANMNRVTEPKPIVWAFWRDAARRARFGYEARSTTLFLGKWLLLAFTLESLLLAYVPAEMIATTLGGTGLGPIALATVLGVPAYMNGYAALPLVDGLMGQGMSAGAGMAFLVAGGVTSMPAALAVWALVRPPVFALYIGFALVGAFSAGLLFQLATSL
ncbi:permease [Abyssibius alkaniclasticus]|uniref:permease n=1 Tax=Abyssibius alkaniclasticus TaxID=2881234 RepID=UPI004058F286